MPNPHKVTIYRAGDDVSSIVAQAVADSGLHGKRKIFIKPNLSHPEYLPGVVTSPQVMHQLVGLLRDGNSEVVVGESNGFNYPCWTAFDKTGMQKAVESAGGKAINLSEDKVVEVKFQRQYTPKTSFSTKNGAGRRCGGGFAIDEDA